MRKTLLQLISINNLIKRVFFSLLLIVSFLFLGNFSNAEEEIVQPTKDFYVLDQLGWVNSDLKSYIIRMNRSLENKTGSQICIVTIKDLNGESPKDYSVRLFDQWKIGDKNKDNGLLILLAHDSMTNKNYVEITPGYGLEGRLNDGKVGRMIDEYMYESLKAGDYSAAIENGFNAFLKEVTDEYQVKLEDSKDPVVTKTTEDESELGLRHIIIAIIILLLLFTRPGRSFLWMLLLSGGNGRGGYFGGGGGFSGTSGGGGSTGGGGAGRSF